MAARTLSKPTCKVPTSPAWFAAAAGLIWLASPGEASANPVTEKPVTEPAPAPASASEPAAPAPALTLSLRALGHDPAFETPMELVGADVRRQLIVSGQRGDEQPFDLTHEVRYSVQPAQVVEVSPDGLLVPLGDGAAKVTITREGAAPLVLPVRVRGFAEPQPISFGNDIVPIFTRYGCNGGGCHGKAEGQNNFRLSLLGYEPEKDHEYLVAESRGRRIFPAAPEHSLLLTKATGETPHGGGARMKRDSYDYDLLVRWIKRGLPPMAEDDPEVERIEVYPRDRVLAPGSQQQLAVTAFYSDGTQRDITRAAQFEANQPEMAEASEEGLVSLHRQTGTTSVMVRFQEHVDVFQATIPLGLEVPRLPEPRNLIDEHIFTKLDLLGLPPSAPADDSDFLRRVTLDIAGRLPSPEETRAFLANQRADKRDLLIDRLLASPDYADYFAGKWSAILRNKRSKDEYARGTYAFHDWIRDQLRNNVRYDEMVSSLLTASGELGRNPAVAWYRAVKDPKEQMQDVAQVFLGIRMQCAQCHHHPYEKWSQNDYYGFTAFFSTVGRKAGEEPTEEVIFHRRIAAGARNPNSGATLPPTPLGADPLELTPGDDPRRALAGWMRDPENPFFARMLVNRYWKHFFSRGLVEPEDDLRVTNPATHPALLGELADDFIAHDFDLKHLIRRITRSHSYQLAAAPNEHNASDQQNYSRFYPRRLPAEVLLDAINDVTLTRNQFTGQAPGTRAVSLPDDRFNSQSYFLSVFGRPENSSACECERTSDANLAQSLHLINSSTIHKKLSDAQGRAAKLAAAKEGDDEARIRELYLQALSRDPNESEIALAAAHLEKKRRQAESEPAEGEKAPDPTQLEREAFEDLMWTLLNTKEFLFNH